MKVRKVKKQLKKFIDKKATAIGRIPVTTLMNRLIPKTNSMFKKLGFYYESPCDGDIYFNNVDGMYTNGVLAFKCMLSLSNIGYNQNGELRFVDAKICKIR